MKQLSAEKSTVGEAAKEVLGVVGAPAVAAETDKDIGAEEKVSAVAAVMEKVLQMLGLQQGLISWAR